MHDDQPSLEAHSIAEVYLYYSVTPCPSCGESGGKLVCDEVRAAKMQAGAAPQLDANWRCRTCGRSGTTAFVVPPGFNLQADPTVINPFEAPSRLIDLAEWLTLFGTLVAAASRETNKTAARQLGLEAAQCLDEALKFYDEVDNDLPGPESFYSQRSRQRFSDHPEHFSRQRLLAFRNKLPTHGAGGASAAPKRRKRFLWW